MKRVFSMTLVLLALFAQAQGITVVPTMSPAGGTHEDNVKVVCTFPEGCAGGKYWFNGGELTANRYEGAILVDYTCDLSIAGINAEGRIITDVVTKHFDIQKVTPAWATPTPKEGLRKESFYVTKIYWNNVMKSELDMRAFMQNGERYGEPVVWLTNEKGKSVAYNDYNGLWQDGLNGYKAYIYKNYKQELAGTYTLHIAAGVFVLDGVRYDKELSFTYEVGGKLLKPEFDTPEGEYTDSVQVSITYPDDDVALYKFYKVGSAKRKQYVGPFWVKATSTVEAWGIDEASVNETEHVSATYTIVSAPVVDHIEAPVFHREGNTVTLSAVEGATIKYWVNDSMQTAALYKDPITVTRNGKLSAVAYTDKAVSNESTLWISNFVVDRGDYGENYLFTPSNLPELYVSSMSANGRYAVGHVGSGSSSRGFVWDLDANRFEYVKTIYVNQLYYISNDGSAYGWTLLTQDLNEDVTDADIHWGIYRDGEWTDQPEGMTVNGLTSDGKLFGSRSNKPVIYDVESGEYIVYKGEGAITSVAEDKTSVVGGYVVESGVRKPAIWYSTTEVKTDNSKTIDGLEITDLSANGEWAIVGRDYRWNLSAMNLQHMLSTSHRHSGNNMPEVVRTIANDGTVFGTFDSSYLSPDKGAALVYTTDNRWRSAADWLRDTKGIIVPGYLLTSIRAVTGDHNMLLMHTFPILGDVSETFTRGLALQIDVQVRHLYPTSLQATQMPGAEIVKVSWEAPIQGADDVTAYTLMRDGKQIYSGKDMIYYDQEVKSGNSYVYSMTCTYKDGVVSKVSAERKVNVVRTHHLPISDLRARQVGLGHLWVQWKAPAVSIPKLQYFHEDRETMAFGTSNHSSEWGIRIPAEDLEVYKSEKIRTFQFLPSGRQDGYTMHLYRGIKGTDDYEDEPFYSQDISPDELNYGSVNTIVLKEPQAVPTDVDLFVTLYIDGDGLNMLGVQYDGFRGGYTDLCRVEGVHNKMVSISATSIDSYQIVLPLGIGICSEDQLGKSLVKEYEVKDNGAVVGKTNELKLKLDNVKTGKHTLSVDVLYYDGEYSGIVDQVEVEMIDDAEVYSGVESTVKVNGNTAEITWKEPRNDDRTLLRWGNLTPGVGFPAQPNYETFTAVAIYPMDLTEPYGGDYVITGIYYFPADKATFSISLEDGFDTRLAHFEPKESEVQLGQMNYLQLKSPIEMNPSYNYTLAIDVMDAAVGTCPLAFDTSNEWKDGFSNVLYLDGDYMTLLDVMEVGFRPNWLMGLVIRLKESELLPLQGYNVFVDGKQQNMELLKTTSLTVNNLEEGSHVAAVDVVYNDHIQAKGTPTVFRVGQKQAIEQVEAELWGMDGCYDMLGRRVHESMLEHGVYIMNGQKVIK